MTIPDWKMVGFGFTTDGREFGEIQIDALGVLIRVYALDSEVFGRAGAERGPQAAARIAERMNKLEAYAANSTEDMRERVEAIRESKWLGEK